MGIAYLQEVHALHDALKRLPGVIDVGSDIDNLQALTAADLAQVTYGHLPHAALRRTDGGLADEVLVQIQFRIEQSAAGWRSLEFLAWFIRDEARSGEFLQLRPFALSPMIDGVTRLGQTLGFHIDLFCEQTGGDLVPVLSKVADLSRDLNTAIDMYADALYRQPL